MKFTVSSTDLLSHLQAISREINSKNSPSILENFSLQLRTNLENFLHEKKIVYTIKKDEFVYKGYGSLYRALENSIEENKMSFFQCSLFNNNENLENRFRENLAEYKSFAQGYQTPNSHFQRPKLKWIFWLFAFLGLCYFMSPFKEVNNSIEFSNFNFCLVQINNIQKE